MHRRLIACILAFGTFISLAAHGEAQWYKGATHVHSLWSDGNGSPEIIADWYKSHDFDFMSFSEHNILMEGDKFVTIDKPKGHLTEARFQDLQKRFGKDWPVVREADGKRQMRLKTFVELSAHFNEPGKFLLVPAEEMTTQGGNPHMNVLNVREVVPGAPKGSDHVAAMHGYLNTIEVQKAKHDTPMLVHLNHPNYSDQVTTEEMLLVRGLRYFEVYNGIGHAGNAAKGVPHPERHWDVIMSMKLRRDPAYLLYGVATDDSHRYFKFGTGIANPGRGWVMVHAEKLEANALVNAMLRGDFYGSCGVTLNSVERSAAGLAIDVAAEDGVAYTTRYIGTRKGFDIASKPFRDVAGAAVPGSSLVYSDAIGEVLYETTDLKSEYALTGDELYVRATVTSDKPMANPAVKGDLEMAWVQPVLAR
jgi:hypothetical protein